VGVLELVGEPAQLLERPVIDSLLSGAAQPRLDRPPVALGQVLHHTPLLVADERWDGHVAKYGPHRLAQSLGAVDQDSILCSGSRPRSTRSDNKAVATVAFSDDPSHRPS
jgi:hypothetical protein